MEERELEQIRRRWEEYSYANGSAYRAFMQCAHADVGKLLAEVDRLHQLQDDAYDRALEAADGR